MTRLCLVGALALPLVACGLVTKGLDHTVGSCDLRESEVTQQSFCQEWRGLVVAPAYPTQEGLCATLGSSYEESECPDTSTILGGCYLGKLGDGSASYQWYYSSEAAPMTRDDVVAECGEDDEATFVDWFPFDVEADDFAPP
jgi:hypothetical protein